jgi:hypothetical protein
MLNPLDLQNAIYDAVLQSGKRLRTLLDPTFRPRLTLVWHPRHSQRCVASL